MNKKRKMKNISSQDFELRRFFFIDTRFDYCKCQKIFVQVQNAYILFRN